MKAGTPACGEPFDPFLAALYARCDGGLFGDLEIIGFSPEVGSDILKSNELMRERSRELQPRLLKCLKYGSELGKSHYFATVPFLANEEGVQPVIFFQYYIELWIYPLASSVDRAFDLWARFVDARLRRYGRLDEFMLTADVPYIWREAQLIAQDAELVRMLEAGKFDELMGDDPDNRQWRQSILQAARAN